MTHAALTNTRDVGDPLARPLPAGTILLHGQYRIERYLNSGGFGITYIARDSLDRELVLKECLPVSISRRDGETVAPRNPAYAAEQQRIVKAFVYEAKVLARLDHPGIVGVREVFEANGTAYMALDRVRGTDLRRLIEEGSYLLHENDLEDILCKTLRVIGYLHSKGLLHRDISPDNILVTPDLEPVLIDFGAVKVAGRKDPEGASAMRATKDGYAPPELYGPEGNECPASDLFALAASIYHVILGELPPDSRERQLMTRAGRRDPYVPLLGRVDGHGKAFLASIDKALALRPSDRPASAEAWLRRLRDRPAPPPATTGEATETGAAGSTPARKRGQLLWLRGTSIALICATLAGLPGGLAASLSATADSQPATETTISNDIARDGSA